MLLLDFHTSSLEGAAELMVPCHVCPLLQDMEEKQLLLPLAASQGPGEKGTDQCTGVTCSHLQPAPGGFYQRDIG